MVYFKKSQEDNLRLNLEFLKSNVYHIVFICNEAIYYKGKIIKTK